MEPFIQLVCSENRQFNAHLKLSRRRAELSGDNVVDIVYQWIIYDEYEVFGVVEGSIARFDLLINDTPIYIDRERSYVTNGRISIIPTPQDLRPFANIFGFTNICLHLVMRNGEQIYWYTDMLAVAVEEGKKEYSASLQQMLWEIYRKDRAMLLCRSRRTSNADGLQNNDSLLHTCIERLYQLLPIFISNSRRYAFDCGSRQSWESRRLGAEYLSGSAAVNGWGPQYGWLGAAASLSAGSYAPPRMSRPISRGVIADDYEDRAIISFINLLLHTVCERLEELRIQNTREELTITYRGELQPGYELSNAILGQFLITVIRERLFEAEELKNSLGFLSNYYAGLLGKNDEILFMPPRRTSKFMHIPHYAGMFDLMAMWFIASESGEGPASSSFRFASADVIYEFYCLNSIQEIVEEAGFVEDKERRTAFDYPYRPPKFNTYSGDNTFYYDNGETGCQLTLYYQPLIYVDVGDELNNGIGLVRVDIEGSRYFYSPDFLLKRTDASGTAYGIIDAKWRTRDTIMRTALADAVNKYLHCIVERDTWKSVPFMWLLQGKDDEDNTDAYRRFSSPLCYGENAPSWLRDSLGVVRLTPASGREEFASVLETFLLPGTFIE